MQSPYMENPFDQQFEQQYMQVMQQMPPLTPQMPQQMPPQQMPQMPPQTQMPQMPPQMPQQMPQMPKMPEEYDMGDLGPNMLPGDPPPILSNNPATANIVLFKELTGYPNYGNPSGNADILYTGNRGTWTFDTPAFLFVPGNLRSQLIIRAVLDDHANVPVNRYSLRITVNGVVVHNGAVPLAHGFPAGGMFNNWRDLTFNITNVQRITRIVIQNTSNAGTDDWIGFDWMQLRSSPRR